MTEHEERAGEPRRPRVVDKRVAHGGGGAGPASPPPTPADPPPAAPPEVPPAQSSSEGPPTAAFTGPDGQVWTPEQEAEARKMAQEIAETPSIEWVVNSAVSLANIAATKLDLGHPADAGLAIDALAGILKEVGPKLGNVEQPLRQTLAQLQMAFAERATGMSPPAAP